MKVYDRRSGRRGWGITSAPLILEKRESDEAVSFPGSRGQGRSFFSSAIFAIVWGYSSMTLRADPNLGRYRAR